MRPMPISPSVLPVISMPGAWFFAAKPISRYSLETGMIFFASVSISVKACSATERLFAFGVMVTAMPWLLQ